MREISTAKIKNAEAPFQQGNTNRFYWFIKKEKTKPNVTDVQLLLIRQRLVRVFTQWSSDHFYSYLNLGDQKAKNARRIIKPM